MRVTFVYALATGISIMLAHAVDSSGQEILDRKITIEAKNVKFKEVLSRIERKAEVKFTYRSRVIDPQQEVTLLMYNARLEEVLVSLFSDRISYEVIGRQIILTTSGEASLPREEQNEQALFPVSGTVVDEDGNALPGVNILVKGTTVGTTTDSDGRYTIDVPDAQSVLVFTFIGYRAVEMPVNSQSTLNVSMELDITSLQELVVVGYGEQKRSDITGAVGSVKADELTNRPAVNVEQALQGRVSGVNVMVNSGRPGGRTNVRIRGYSSINASNEPLYVVDGIIWAMGIDALNPSDIESIDVLKDASATAIYGTRGANGVILITTKRGETGGGINYDMYVSSSTMARKRDVLNAQQFLEIEDRAYQNLAHYDPQGWADGDYADKDPVLKRTALIGTLFDDDLNPLYDVDWQDEVTQTAISQNHNLSFTGGSDETTYGLFLNYTDNQGIIKGTYQTRYTARLVIDNYVRPWLKVGATINYSNTNERRADERVGANNIPRMMIEMIPIVPIRYPDGTYGKRTDYPDMESGDNPVALINEDVRLYKTQVFGGNTYLNVTLLPGLDFQTTLGVNLSSQHNPYYESAKVALTSGFKSYAEIWSYDRRFIQWQNYLTYKWEMPGGHSFNAVAGTEIQKWNYLEWFAGTENMPDDFYKYYNLGTGSTPRAPSSSTSAYQMASYFGRVNYNFKEKILVTATARTDGSSRFGADNKYAFFPSAAVAWRLSQESFLADNRTISDLKVRASYGLTGNSEIGQYQSLANLASNTYIFDGTRASGTVISTLANPNLKWEKTAQTDIGVSLSLFDARVNVEADVFLKETKDLLLSAPVPTSSGYSSIYKNIGSMENRGLEFSLNTVNVETENFSWSTTFNISLLKNEVTALGEANDDIFPGPNFLSNTNILRVGEPVGSFYGLKRLGTWSTDEADEAAVYNKKPGDLKFWDKDQNGEINDADRIIMGNGIADGFGSFINSFRYKNFDLMIDLQFMYGNDILNLTHHSALDRTGQANSYADVLNAWTPENQDSYIAGTRPSYLYYDSKIDSYKVEDGSFIRGRNIMLGYNFPSELASRLKLSRLRAYVSAQNFFVVTDYSGYDPEVTTYNDAFAQGIQFFDYPKARVFTAGLNVSF